MKTSLSSLEEKRKAALEWLGDRWILHPKHAAQKKPRKCEKEKPEQPQLVSYACNNWRKIVF